MKKKLSKTFTHKEVLGMRKIRYSHAINEALYEEMERDETVFVAGEDVAEAGGSFGVTRNLYQKFGPSRVIDTPISESGIIGLAIGSSATGLRPVVEIMFMDFLATCWDQVINQAAKMRYMFGGNLKLPLVIRTQCGAGFSAGPQHSQSLEALCAHIPGLKVVMPSSAYDAKGLLKSSIRDDNPVIFIENKVLYGKKGEVPDEDYTISLGSSNILRQGEDVTIATYSQMVDKVNEAVKRLSQEGIEAEVIDIRSITPLDIDTIIGSVKKTNRLVIVHEAVKRGGVGSEIAALVQEKAFDYLDAPIQRIGAPYSPVPYSKPLEKYYLPDENNIFEVVTQIVY